MLNQINVKFRIQLVHRENYEKCKLYKKNYEKGKLSIFTGTFNLVKLSHVLCIYNVVNVAINQRQKH